MTAIPNPLLSSAQARPFHLALVEGSQELTYAELLQRVTTLAGALVDAGVQAGDTIAILGHYNTNWVVALHAVGWLGAAVLPLNPEHSIQVNLTAAGCHKASLCLVDSHHHRLLAESQMETLLFTTTSSRQVPERFWQLEETRLILTTSGSTGEPQSIRLTTSQILFAAMGSMVRLGHGLTDRWLCALSLHHMGGLAMCYRAIFGAVTLELALPFNARFMLERLASGQVSLCSMVPDMLRRVLALQGESSLSVAVRAILVGGEACPKNLLQAASKAGYPVALTWGMTESASQIATRFAGDLREDAGCGPSLEFSRVYTEGDALVVQGPQVPGGYFKTSDSGFVDEQHCVQVQGREDDIFISGGKNISPKTIEDALGCLPTIEQAAVVGFPHSRWGMRPVAFLVLVAGETPRSDADLRRLLSSTLTGAEIPDQFFVVSRLPQLGIGKLNRSALRRTVLTLGLGRELELSDHIHELLGQVTRLEGGKFDNGVDHLTSTAQSTVVAHDPVLEGDGSGSHIGNGDVNVEPLPQAHGAGVVGVGVNEGHAPLSIVENVTNARAAGHEELLEHGVTILVNSTEKSDPSAIDFVETNGNDMLKSHGCSSNQSEGWSDESV